MKAFKSLLLIALAGSLALTSCNNEQTAGVAPKEDKSIQELAVRWSATTESREEITRTIAEYKALDAASLDQFIQANAANKIRLGGNKQAWELQAKAQMEINRRAVARYGKGYNQIEPGQYDALSKEVYRAAPYDAVTTLFAITPPPVPGGRVSNIISTPTTCTVYQSGGTSCTYPLVAAFGDGGAFAVTTASSQAACGSSWGFAKKNGQRDCDFFLHFADLAIPRGTDPDSYWRALWATSAELHDFINNMGIGVEVRFKYNDGAYAYINKTLLFGADRTTQIGGMQAVANRVRLNPNF